MVARGWKYWRDLRGRTRIDRLHWTLAARAMRRASSEAKADKKAKKLTTHNSHLESHDTRQAAR
jgi:hypothetical protein